MLRTWEGARAFSGAGHGFPMIFHVFIIFSHVFLWPQRVHFPQDSRVKDSKSEVKGEKLLDGVAVCHRVGIKWVHYPYLTGLEPY